MDGGVQYDSALNTWVTKNADGLVTSTWNRLTNEWVLNPENLIYTDYKINPTIWSQEFGGVYLYKAQWTDDLANQLQRLTQEELIDDSVVPEGEFYQYQTTDTSGSHTLYHEFGVYVGDMVEVPSSALNYPKQYVAQILLINPNYPDRRYYFHIVLSEGNAGTASGLDFSAGALDNPGVGAMLDPSRMFYIGPDVVNSLKSMRGQRIILDIPTTITYANGDVKSLSDLAALVDAINHGSPIPSGVQYRLQVGNLRLPHVLNPRSSDN